MNLILRIKTHKDADVKQFIILIYFILYSSQILALDIDHESNAPKPNIPSAYTFDGESYSLTWSDKKDGSETHEYFRKGENTKNWSKLFAVRRYEGYDSAVELLTPYLKKINPVKSILVANNYDDGTNDVTAFFHVFPDDLSYVEYNVHRFVYDEKAGAVYTFQFATRSAKHSSIAELQEFSKNVGNVRDKWLRDISKLTIKQGN